MSARQAVTAGAPTFGMLRAMQARQAVKAGAPVFGMLRERMSEVQS